MEEFISCICKYDGLTLITPLGDWILLNNDEWIDSWDWFLDINNQLLYHHIQDDTWVVHARRAHSHHSYSADPCVCDTRPSQELKRVSIIIYKDRISVSNSSPRVSVVDEINTLVLDDIQMTNPKIDWFNSYISCTANTSTLRQHIISGTALAVSDRPYYPNEEVGACAWTISTPDGKERVQGGGVIPGVSKEQNSYRAELGGQLGIANFIECVDVPPGSYKIKTVCDGLSALDKVGVDKEYIRNSAKHVDMISIITDLWKRSQFSPICEHVYGHQNEVKEPLTMLAN